MVKYKSVAVPFLYLILTFLLVVVVCMVELGCKKEVKAGVSFRRQ